MKILFLGAGNMGQAIIKGILSGNTFKAEDITVYEIDENTRKKAVDLYRIHSITDLKNNTVRFDAVIVAVKPQSFTTFETDTEISSLIAQLTSHTMIISIMAGVSIQTLKDKFKNCSRFIRVMPNTPALIGEGMSVLSFSEHIPKEMMEQAVSIFQSIGKTEILDEKYLDAVTGLSGSGPAFVFLFVESLIQGGILSGLAKPVAEKLAIQTVLGSVSMLDGSRTIEEYRHMVTSPAGTTIEGIRTLEENNVRYAVMQAVKNASDRSKELGKKS